jgi:hypothetical protein
VTLHVQRPAHGRQRRSMRTKEPARSVRRLKVMYGEKREKQRIRTSYTRRAVEMMRSNSRAHGSAKLSPVAEAELLRVRELGEVVTSAAHEDGVAGSGHA